MDEKRSDGGPINTLPLSPTVRGVAIKIPAVVFIHTWYSRFTLKSHVLYANCTNQSVNISTTKLNSYQGNIIECIVRNPHLNHYMVFHFVAELDLNTFVAES